MQERLERKLKKRKLSNAVIKHILKSRTHWLRDLRQKSSLVPIYPYWPVATIKQGKSTSQLEYFADGGNLENTGVATLVRQGYNKIISFINTSTPLSVEVSASGRSILSVADYLAALFGFTPMLQLDGEQEKRYYRYDELTEDQFKQLSKSLRPYYNNQIFETEQFYQLLTGLNKANSRNGALGFGPAVFIQALTTVENKKFDIKPGQSTQVVWNYLTPASDWTEQLSSNVQNNLSEKYPSFPNYSTIKDIGMEKQQINLLAHFTYWMLMSTAPSWSYLYPIQ